MSDEDFQETKNSLLIDDDEEISKESQDVGGYTLEEKIVSAVWVHERIRNNMSWVNLRKCFILRFGTYPPAKRTLKNWERKLFAGGSVRDAVRSGRPCARLMHVPYVKASIAESPNMSLRERAQELGLPRSTLLKILKYDLKMTFVPDPVNKNGKSRSNFAQQSGIWTFNEPNANPVDQEQPQVKMEEDYSETYSSKNHSNNYSAESFTTNQQINNYSDSNNYSSHNQSSTFDNSRNSIF